MTIQNLFIWRVVKRWKTFPRGVATRGEDGRAFCRGFPSSAGAVGLARSCWLPLPESAATQIVTVPLPPSACPSAGAQPPPRGPIASLGWMRSLGGIGQAASVAFPLLVGCATRSCAGIVSLLHALLWRNCGLSADGVLFSWKKLGLPTGPHPSSFAAPAGLVVGPQCCGTSAGIGSSPSSPGCPVEAVELVPRPSPRSSTTSILQRSHRLLRPGPCCGLSCGTCSVACPRHRDAPRPRPCPTTTICRGGPGSAPSQLGLACCGTSAGIGSLWRAGPRKNPRLPAGGAGSSRRRPGCPVRAFGVGSHDDQCPETCPCFSSGCSPGRAEPCCGHLGASSGTCFVSSLWPWRGRRRGLCWKTCGAGGRGPDVSSCLQSGVEISLRA